MFKSMVDGKGACAVRKRIRALVLALLCVLALAGCGSGSVGQNLGRYVEERNDKPPMAANSGVKAEIATYTDANFADVLGFNVVQTAPNTAMSATKFFTIDGWFGQIEFLTGDGRVLVLRVAKDTEKDLSTTYAEKHSASTETRTVDGVDVNIRTAKEGCGAAAWKRDGYQFYLHSNKAQGRPTDAEIDAVAASVRCG